MSTMCFVYQTSMWTRTRARGRYYDDTDGNGQRNVPCGTNYHNVKRGGVRLLCPVWHGSALFDEVRAPLHNGRVLLMLYASVLVCTTPSVSLATP